jgi:predicted NUDIX family NTP pyrophosphohydrolase
LEVLLAHQGGPLRARKDIGHWTIPKGEVEPGEEFAAVARR